MIGEWPNKKNIESLNLTQKVNIFRLWCGKIFNRCVLPLMFDPRLPNISNILYRFLKVMTQNPILKKIFPDPPMP